MRYEPDREMRRIREEAAPRRAGGAVEQAAALRSAAELLDVDDPPPLRPEALARIRRGVEERLAPAARGSRRRWSLAAAAAIGFLLVTAVGAGAALWRYQRLEAGRTAAEAGDPTPAPAAKRRLPRHRATVAAGGAVVESEDADLSQAAALAPSGEPMPAPRNQAAPAPAKSPAPAPAKSPAPAPAKSPAPAPMPATPALGSSPLPGDATRSGAAVDRRPTPVTSSESPTAAPRAETEARMLARALAQLRQQHDPRAALTTLDRLDQTYPGGVLAPEALATRIEAALAMNDLATATKLVDAAAPPAGRAGAALLVVRAELRARAGRCDEATRDFVRVLDTTSAGAGDLHERALYGRGVCLGHLGQAAAARRDLTAYLREHPNGRFSGEARRLLDQSSGAP